MNIRMYQQTWHGIDLTSLAASPKTMEEIAGPEFYTEFYARLSAGEGHVDPIWVENKRSLGHLMVPFFTRWQEAQGRSPRILALAVGKAIVEGEWLKAGFDVTFNECQSDSLKELQEKYPTAKTLLGDVKSLSTTEQYDIVTLIALDCVLNHEQLGQLLERIKPWLTPKGEILVYCTNALSWRQFTREVVKYAIGHYRRHRHIFWGWWRSPSEFLRLAEETGMEAEVYTHHGNHELRKRSSWRAGWMNRNSPQLTVVYRPDTSYSVRTP